jgi:hypothetical protein
LVVVVVDLVTALEQAVVRVAALAMAEVQATAAWELLDKVIKVAAATKVITTEVAVVAVLVALAVKAMTAKAEQLDMVYLAQYWAKHIFLPLVVVELVEQLVLDNQLMAGLADQVVAATKLVGQEWAVD